MITLGITAGDPAGIGPEVILKALSAKAINRRVRWVIIGDSPVFTQTARQLRLKLSDYPLIDCRQITRLAPAANFARSGAASLKYLDTAVRLWCLGYLQGLVTAPVTKWAIQKSAPSFVGHTEYFAKATRSRQVVMMFASDQLRIVVLTRHVPLATVSRALTQSLVVSAVRMTAAALKQDFAIMRPKIALCGINPHAGEGKALSEESRVLVPAIKQLNRSGISCDGPVAADGFFAGPIKHDAVVAAYHDQGLIPFKMAARDKGCQVTLGLPFVRTSPDHGSALDIAGKGKADCGSMVYAMNLAARLALKRYAHGS